MSAGRTVVRAAFVTLVATACLQGAAISPAEAANPYCGKANIATLHNGHYDYWKFERHFSDALNHHHIWRQSHTGALFEQTGCPSDW